MTKFTKYALISFGAFIGVLLLVGDIFFGVKYFSENSNNGSKSSSSSSQSSVLTYHLSTTTVSASSATTTTTNSAASTATSSANSTATSSLSSANSSSTSSVTTLLTSHMDCNPTSVVGVSWGQADFQYPSKVTLVKNSSCEYEFQYGGALLKFDFYGGADGWPKVSVQEFPDTVYQVGDAKLVRSSAFFGPTNGFWEVYYGMFVSGNACSADSMENPNLTNPCIDRADYFISNRGSSFSAYLPVLKTSNGNNALPNNVNDIISVFDAIVAYASGSR